MKLTKEEVQHIAKLSRLELDKSQVEMFRSQLSSVLEYVEKLNEVDTENVEETSQVTGLENVFRNDEVEEFKDSKKLIEQAPDHEDNQIRVNKVL